VHCAFRAVVGRTAGTGEVMPQQGSSHTRSDLGPGGRAVALLLALVWFAAGTLAIVLGVRRGHWIPPLLGLPALAYALAWAQVARTGRRLRWPRRRR
jgi:hypothetical protein